MILSSTANSYAGDTTIRQGILQIAGASTLGNGNGTLNLSGGTLQSSASRSIATPNPINLTDDSTITTTATGSTPNFEFSSDSISGTNGTLTFTNSSATAANTFRPRFSGVGFDFSRPIVLANGSGNFTELNLFNVDGTEQIFSGQISGNGSINRSVSSGVGGNTVLTASNTFSGGITLTRGSIGVGNNNALGTGAITPNGGGIYASGGARVVQNDFTFNNGLTIGGAANISFTGAFNLGSANRNITVTNSAATTISGSIASTVASGSSALTKLGSGVLEISSDNSYAGDTVVSDGTLKVSNSTGSATGSGTVIVSNTGVLSGAGTVGGIALSNGGKAAPGNGVGILNAASATFADAGSLQVEINDANTALPSGTGVDLLNIQGALTISATSGAPFVIDVSSVGGLAANFDNTQTYSWIIAKAAGGITGFSPDAFTVSTANFQNDLGSKTFSVSTDGSGNLLLNFGSAVPPQPTIDSNIVGAGTGDAQLSWTSVSGVSYTVQYKTNLNQVDWLTLTNIVATDATSSAHDTTTPVPSERYYRVISP
jgi:autotransporter-associated beta strand protein